MVNRPNEKDQINMIIKNLLLAYNSRLLSSPISYFRELCDCGEGETKPPIKKTYEGGATTSKAPNLMNVNAIIPQPTLTYSTLQRRPVKNFLT